MQSQARTWSLHSAQKRRAVSRGPINGEEAINGGKMQPRMQSGRATDVAAFAAGWPGTSACAKRSISTDQVHVARIETDDRCAASPCSTNPVAFGQFSCSGFAFACAHLVSKGVMEAAPIMVKSVLIMKPRRRAPSRKRTAV